MSKAIYYNKMTRENEYKEFMSRLFEGILTAFTLSILLMTLIIVCVGNSKIEIPNFTIEERIPVKKMFSDYIKSLPIPKDEIIEMVVKDKGEKHIEGNIVCESSQSTQVASKQIEVKAQASTPTTVNFLTTAYCPCEKCCGKTDGISASNKKCVANHTIAAGNKYPLGTVMYIPELSNTQSGGWYEVEDRGGAISNLRLDIFFNTHEEAIQYGVKNVEAYVYLP